MVRCGTAAALLLCLTAKAWAAPADDDARAGEAKKLCAAGQVTDGVAILAELFARTGDVDYVYNQGRCYQQNNRPDESIARFREYLRRARGLSTQERSEVETFLKELEAERDANARRLAATAASTPRAESAREPAVVGGGATGPASRFGGPTVARASLLFGGALLIAGSVSWLVANGKYSSLEDDCNRHDCTQARYDSGTRSVRTWDTLAGAGLIGGAVGVLGGLALTVRGRF
jgi:hypothetical protein